MNADFRIDALIIETERLILRGFKQSDLCDLYEYASVEGVGEMAGWNHHESIEKSKEILDMFINENKVFAIVFKESGKVIGSLGVEKYGLEDKLTEFDGYRGREIGYVLSKAYWGKGIMPEAVGAVIDYLFNDLDLDFLTCGYYDFNSQSKRVQEKCDFKPYRKLIMDTRLGTKEPGVLNLLINPNKNITFAFSHPETLIYDKSRMKYEMNNILPEINLELTDNEWPYEYTDHDRQIVRAIVFDDEGYFYFVRADRDDDFGRAVIIETSGGGVEEGENHTDAIKRELREELGVEAEVICKIGVVSDYYNLIHRHNINNFYLCRALSFGDTHLTNDEANYFHLSTLKLSFDEAVDEYEKNHGSRLGRIIANREMPILLRAKEILERQKDK